MMLYGDTIRMHLQGMMEDLLLMERKMERKN
jgi:hypothetical protein